MHRSDAQASADHLPTHHLVIAAKRKELPRDIQPGISQPSDHLFIRIQSGYRVLLQIAHLQRHEAASQQGVQILIVRSGDFMEGKRSGNWLENHLLKRIEAGRVVYSGPLDREHA